MKKIIIGLVVLATAAVTFATMRSVIMADHDHSEIEKVSHSGGLDKNGGHYDRSNGTYHYHR
jgi:hypothetical protein